MDSDPDFKALELRIIALIENRDASIHAALEKANLRIDKHWERMKSMLERLREVEEAVTKLDEKYEDLDSRKLDALDDLEVKSRQERAAIFDQFLHDQGKLTQPSCESEDSDGFDARLQVISARIAEIERIVRSQIR
jgi:hypothetical protein